MDEYELTYLPKYLPENLMGASSSKEILDIYIPTAAEHAILHIRKNGDVFEITKKQPVHGNDSSHQIENTIPLTQEEFSDLSHIPGKRVRKIRYYYNENDTDFEIDIFQDELKGLILVDVEFKSNQAKAMFTPPKWFLADVTQEKFIAGGVLAGKTYAEIEPQLLEYGYKKKT